MAEKAYLVSPSDRSRISAAVRAFESMTGATVSTGGSVTVPPRRGRRARPGDSPFRPFHARLTATAAMAGSDSIFIYTFAEVTLTITATAGTPSAVGYSTVTNGRTGKAMNRAEWANESSTGYAFSVYRAGTDYAATGFAPRPITGGGDSNTHKTNQIVEITGSVVASDGTVIYLFSRQGQHDGPCTP